ncbi:MAG: putative transporter ATP-binding protein [Gemmatimonadetes bacterium]|nr:putative transporter ATP-binding protein [Gemmatimonadota bacterium]
MSAPGFAELAARTGRADVSSLIALRALAARCDAGGALDRTAWLTSLQEEFRRWYASERAAAGGSAAQVANFPDAATQRYLDEHVVRHLAADGILAALGEDGAPVANGAQWHAVRLAPWASAELAEDRASVVDTLDRRIGAILSDHAPAAPRPVPPPEPARPSVEHPAPDPVSAGHPDGEAAVRAPESIDRIATEPAAFGPAVDVLPSATDDAADTTSADVAVDGEPAAAPETEARVRYGPIEGGSTLTATGLVKIYRKRRVVNDVDLHVAQGEIVGLLGPNGAGKTTSFYMMVGLIPPDGGTVRLDRRDLTGVPMFKRARAGIGYLAQEPSIFRRLTVEENILAVLQMMSIPKAEQKRRLETLLDELSIKHLRRSYAYALSGGERRRLEITRALVGNPKFMLLDEPFAGVDPIAVHDIQQIVSDLRRRGIGVLISDHNVEQTLDIVDRAYIMYDGRVRVSGTVSELVWNDEVAEIYLGPTLTARMRERYSSPE